MSFGYNASAAFGNTTATIADHAKDLLTCLVNKREEGDVGSGRAHCTRRIADVDVSRKKPGQSYFWAILWVAL
jgi:hypothetical protein